jgi:hypothetical protein
LTSYSPLLRLARACRRPAVRATVEGLYGSSSHPLSRVRRIDVVSMHLYGAGIRMVRGSFSSAALLPRLSSF